MEDKKLVKVLINYRHENRLSYEVLAKKLGVTRMTVWRWLNGVMKPGPINKHHILKMLGFSPTKFIKIKGEE